MRSRACSCSGCDSERSCIVPLERAGDTPWMQPLSCPNEEAASVTALSLALGVLHLLCESARPNPSRGTSNVVKAVFISWSIPAMVVEGATSRRPERGTDCHSRDGLVARVRDASMRAGPDANRSAGLQSARVALAVSSHEGFDSPSPTTQARRKGILFGASIAPEALRTSWKPAWMLGFAGQALPR